MKKFVLSFAFFSAIIFIVSAQPASKALLIIDIQNFYFPGGSSALVEPEKAAANAKNLVDTYNYLGFIISGTDKEKAKEYFNKALAIEPQNAYALDNLKALSAPATPAKKAPIK